ncbi:hypothetical protein RJT34_30982 [Clitoria ternatea]|uniref:AB hydrolase-1 domain-containing protein n=1 Tax=Clitoria ternatea TaxID=43366 RepID=A0AAN9I0Y0_CLITE
MPMVNTLGEGKAYADLSTKKGVGSWEGLVQLISSSYGVLSVILVDEGILFLREQLLNSKKVVTKFVTGMVSRAAILLLLGLLGMFYQATQLPPPNLDHSSSPSDDFSLSPRVRLSDGRYLAYREKGVPKDKSKHRIIIVHGFGSSKDMNFLAPQELIDELGVYILQYDRAGYGESDPNPKRSPKSEALDIEELADQLQIGSKFYVIGVSMGSYATWSCLYYIPNRLAGVALIAPVINYQWPSLPDSLIKEDYRRKLVHWSVWLASYSPRLLHWWVSQKWLPSNSVIEKNPAFFNKRDIDILKSIPGFPMLTKDKLREQVVFDTLRGDWMAAFGKWEFDPMKLSNPFPQNRSSVHVWQGHEDKVVPSQIQRFVSGKLPWIQYHEVPDGGHLIVHYSGLCEAILKALLLGEEDISYRPRPAASVFVS